MKILFCTGTLLSGGTERVVTNLANSFIKTNEIMIVSLTRTEIAYSLDEKVKVNFLDQKIFDNKLSKKNRIIKNIRRIRKLNNLINNYKPDIIISFLPEPSFLVLMLKIFNKIPTIISVRNDPKVEYQSKLYNFLMKKLYPKADGIVFQTKEEEEYFDNIVFCSKIIIPNPIKEEFICDKYNGVRKKEIVNVGRLQEQKNQKLLIRAFSEISDKYKDYKLVIYGEGILKEELKELICNLDLKDRVILAGTTKNIKDKIYDSSLFILSSTYEGMPNALMEAMALGLPVISTDCSGGGARFLIENKKNGILVKNNDIDDMKNAIDSVLSDKEFASKLGEEANNIKNYLSPNIITKKWSDYIAEIYKLKK